MERGASSPTATDKCLKHAGTEQPEHRRKFNKLTNQAAGQAPIYILRMPALRARIDVSKAAVYDWMNPKSPRYDPKFPVPVKLSAGGAVGWIESEIDDWLASRVRTKLN